MSKRLNNHSGCKSGVYKEIREYFITIILSGLIGALVALPFVDTYDENLFSGLLKGCAAGAAIGFVSRIAFSIMLRTVKSRPFWAFFCIIFTIGGGTLGCSFLFGMTGVCTLALVTALAEVVGLSITFAVYRYSLYLNRKLRETLDKIQAADNKKYE